MISHDDNTAALESEGGMEGEKPSTSTNVAVQDSDASIAPETPSSLPAEEIVIFENCPCGKEAELILVAERQARCVACFFDERMTRPCFQCKTHVVEAMVRAIGVNGQKDFVGVCIRCLNAHVSTQNN